MYLIWLIFTDRTLKRWVEIITSDRFTYYAHDNRQIGIYGGILIESIIQTNIGESNPIQSWPSKIRGEKGKKKKPKFEVHVASFDKRLAANRSETS